MMKVRSVQRDGEEDSVSQNVLGCSLVIHEREEEGELSYVQPLDQTKKRQPAEVEDLAWAR